MAQKPPRPNSENVGSQWLFIGANVKEQKTSVHFADLANEIAGFSNFLQAQLAAVTQSLAASGVSLARKKLRESTTSWGRGRMAGSYLG